jgi:hypothetical protein
MKVVAILNPENGSCRQTLSLLKNLSEEGKEIKEIVLVLENTYKAEKWVLSLSMPLSKTEVEKIKETYRKKVISVWSALTGEENIPPLRVEVCDAPKAVKEMELTDVDLLVLGCLENNSLCKLIETLDKPALVVKN